MRRVCKPSSVPGDRVTVIYLGPRVARQAQATYPGLVADRAGPHPILVLHPAGFASLRPSPDRAVRSYRTVSPLPGSRRAVSFLWHFPSAGRLRPAAS